MEGTFFQKYTGHVIAWVNLKVKKNSLFAWWFKKKVTSKLSSIGKSSLLKQIFSQTLLEVCGVECLLELHYSTTNALVNRKNRYDHKTSKYQLQRVKKKIKTTNSFNFPITHKESFIYKITNKEFSKWITKPPMWCSNQHWSLKQVDLHQHFFDVTRNYLDYQHYFAYK